MEQLAISRRRLLQGGGALGLGLALGGSPLRHLARADHLPPVGLHLTYGADSATAMNVSWGGANIVAPRLAYGIGELGTVIDVVDDRGAPDPEIATRYFHSHLTGLTPGETYMYEVRDGGTPLGHGSFTTAPAVMPASFRFATFGDMGVSEGAKAVLARILEFDPALAFVVGDLCYADLSGGTGIDLPYNPRIWDQWLHQIQPSSASMPWMTTVGNHEMERKGSELGYDAFLARFSLPGTGDFDTYWWTRHGNTAFIALDGNDASYEITRNRNMIPGDQDAWLEQTLVDLNADPTITFIVVGFHNCMYCTNALHGSDGGNRGRWQRLFEQYAVDLVVNGHNHCYESTDPEALNGVTYLTVGGGGQAEYPTVTYPVSYVVEEGGVRVPEAALWSKTRFPGHSLALVDVTATEMTVKAITKAGAPIETLTLPARVRQASTSAA